MAILQMWLCAKSFKGSWPDFGPNLIHFVFYSIWTGIGYNNFLTSLHFCMTYFTGVMRKIKSFNLIPKTPFRWMNPKVIGSYTFKSELSFFRQEIFVFQTHVCVSHMLQWHHLHRHSTHLYEVQCRDLPGWILFWYIAWTTKFECSFSMHV